MPDRPAIDSDKLKAALDNLAKTARAVSTTLGVQGAMGAVWSGDHDRARETLRRLPADRLPDIALAAVALAALAEDIAAERNPK